MCLDGYVERENRDWQFVNDEFEEYINDVLRSIDGMILGRVAHQKLAEYWPVAAEQGGDRSQAPDRGAPHVTSRAVNLMNSLPKYVVTDSSPPQAGRAPSCSRLTPWPTRSAS